MMDENCRNREDVPISIERIFRKLARFRGEGFLLETAKLGCKREEAGA